MHDVRKSGREKLYVGRWEMNKIFNIIQTLGSIALFYFVWTNAHWSVAFLLTIYWLGFTVIMTQKKIEENFFRRILESIKQKRAGPDS